MNPPKLKNKAPEFDGSSVAIEQKNARDTALHTLKKSKSKVRECNFILLDVSLKSDDRHSDDKQFDRNVRRLLAEDKSKVLRSPSHPELLNEILRSCQNPT